ncbi:FxsA family protein [Paraferrimonas sp. SM1919]|uniref:FxsA family protein n=1 Tax=Paraferrimonas sp. SM1919 TaxID=2662263 RepID=UPI0013D47CB6|nr:FxsA family protein [Paraferrimonas sp. SM1919]
MRLLLFLLFVIMPILEISVLLQVGEALGGLNTILLIILTALLGANLVRNEGLKTFMKVRSQLQAGTAPAQELVEAVMLAVAGVLLVTPGFITDFIGLVMLTPLTRKPIAWYFLSKINITMSNSFSTHGSFHSHGQFGQNPFEQQSKKDGDVIEGEYSRKDDDNNRPNLH